MDAAELLRWIFSEAGAGWVFGLVSLSALLASFLRRRRPGRVLIRDLYRTSLVLIRPDVRERIGVTLDGSPVSSLGALELEITNEGSEVIRNAQVTIDFGAGTRVLEASRSADLADLPVGIERRDGSLVVTLPYLNPFKDRLRLRDDEARSVNRSSVAPRSNPRTDGGAA